MGPSDRVPASGILQKRRPRAIAGSAGWWAHYGPGLYLYGTHDGGKRWEPRDLAIPQGFTADAGSGETRPPLFFGEKDILLPVIFHTQGLIFYAAGDGGGTWKPTTPLKSATGQSFVWSFPDSTYGFATEGDKLYVTGDGATTWTAITPDTELAGITHLCFVSPQVGWAVIDGTILKTADGGRTWGKLAAATQ